MLRSQTAHVSVRSTGPPNETTMDSGKLHRVHHFNCGSFNPWPRLHLVTHVLLCELEHGLLLVDVGFGQADIEQPRARLGRSASSAGAALLSAETALVQINQLGFSAEDVTDVVATHLDYDHIGGLSDFPDARLHVTAVELDEAHSPTSKTRAGQARYRRAHISEIESVTQYNAFDSNILGLSGTPVDDSERVFIVPLPGHTAGHAAVAVRDPARGWLLHAGDAFMHRLAIRPDNYQNTFTGRAVGLIERLMASDGAKVQANHRTLREVASSGARVFCSHDQGQFEELSK